MLTKRQKKKQIKKLKRRLVSREDYDIDQDLEEIKAAEKRARDKKIALAIRIGAAVLVAAGLFFLVRLIINGVTYSSYEVISENEGTSGGSLEIFDGGVVRFSSSGVKYTDDDEKLIWDQGTTMENPCFTASGDYGLIYDKSGTSLILFNSKGVLASFSTDYPILDAAVSKYGVTVVMVEKGSASEIYYYDNVGGKLDVEIKNVLAESSGYPLSMSISSDGQGVALALMFLDRGGMTSRISFINFEEGADKTDRVVGYYEYDDSVFPEVSYLTDSDVVAFGTGKVCFYSLSNPSSPKISEEINFEEEIKSACAGDSCAAVVSKVPEGGFKLTIFDEDGDVQGEETFAYDYTKMEIIDGYVMLYGSDNMLIATTSGNVKYSGPMDGQVTSMIPLGGNKFLQYGSFGSRTIKLK